MHIAYCVLRSVQLHVGSSCVLCIVYCVLHTSFWGQLRIAYCILRIAQQIRSLILGRAAYFVLRIAYCVLCSFILGAVVYCVLCIVYCTPHFGGTCVWRIAYCVLHSKHVVSFWGELRIAYCVLCSFKVASFWDFGDSCALCSVYCV